MRFKEIARTNLGVATLAATLLLVLGCASPALTPRAEGVRVLEAAPDLGCTKLGRARVKVTTRVFFLSRNASTVTRELETLARNAAAEMDGNAVAPEGSADEQGQRFDLYRCADAP